MHKKKFRPCQLKTFADDLQLLPVSERTQQACWLCVRQFADHFHKAPAGASCRGSGPEFGPPLSLCP